MLLVVDYQVGLFQLVRDYTPDQFKTNIIAHAALAKLFNLPVVITSSADTGSNGPVPVEITEMHPNAPFIRRQGEVNAWDNPEFRAAVRAANKTQIIIGGIVTDVCTAFLALSLREEGYEVFANTEASGTFNERLATEANDRMKGAGVTLMGMFAILSDLMRDWRNTPGAAEVLPFIDTYLTAYGFLARAFAAAASTGSSEQTLA
ncbi:hypothetical protein Q9L58_005763 [Maublancomyces gigas]|uniref:Isochorismatase-like domain-containing protein n=1 Tax=Discina gigas TaxID=1032678 RepID=A0ABR3GH49_9PEZI